MYLSHAMSVFSQSAFSHRDTRPVNSAVDNRRIVFVFVETVWSSVSGQ